jgi:acetoin utilization deacetylase AcuC-like enzyme
MKVFYSPDYVASGTSFDTTRKSGWIAESLAKKPIAGVELVAPEPLTIDQIAAVHDPVYVEAVQSGKPKDLAESQGFDWDPGMWRAVTASNGGAVAAARAALKDGVSGSLSSGLHHARRECGAAYCTFNGLVIAAATVIAEGAESVLIIDLDAHCGGGTHSMIEETERIQQMDVSVNAVDAYWMNHGNTLDLVRDAEKYLPTIRERLDGMTRSFDLILYNAGMDPDERCQVGGLPGINAGILRRREQIVFEWAKSRQIPIAFVLAGGYSGSELPQDELVRLHRMTLECALRTV